MGLECELCFSTKTIWSNSSGVNSQKIKPYGWLDCLNCDNSKRQGGRIGIMNSS